MKTESAKALNLFLNDAVTLFVNILEDREIQSDDLSITRVDLNENRFADMYSTFEAELTDNMVEYNDIDMAYDYIRTCLNEFNQWVGFGKESNAYIIQKGNDVNLLLKTKQHIEYYKTKISRLLDDTHSYKPYELRRIFDKATEPEVVEEQVQEPLPNDSYIFDKMLAEITAQSKTTLEIIGFINDRLCEFRKWQLTNDTQYEYDSWGKIEKTLHSYSRKHYTHFERLCALEIDKLENKHKLEKAELTKKAIENNPVVIQGTTTPQFQWTASDTDLIELVTALYHRGSIERKDGKPLTRKSLLEFFQQLFNIEIKDVEGKLARATNRKINNTPFLDSLKGAFENYADEKMEKQSKRK